MQKKNHTNKMKPELWKIKSLIHQILRSLSQGTYSTTIDLHQQFFLFFTNLKREPRIVNHSHWVYLRVRSQSNTTLNQCTSQNI